MEHLYYELIDFITRLITGLDNHHLSLSEFFLYHSVRNEVIAMVNCGLTIVWAISLVCLIIEVIVMLIRWCAKSTN